MPNTALDYRALATGVPVRSLYGNGGSACSEMSVSVDASVIGIAAGSLTIYDKQNDECRPLPNSATSLQYRQSYSRSMQDFHVKK